jgi:hypothetical protein
MVRAPEAAAIITKIWARATRGSLRPGAAAAHPETIDPIIMTNLFRARSQRVRTGRGNRVDSSGQSIRKADEKLRPALKGGAQYVSST